MLDRTCLTEHAWLPVAVARGSGYSWHVSRITDNYNTRRTRTCPTRTTTCKFPQTLSPGSICRPAPFVARLHICSIDSRFRRHPADQVSSPTWPGAAFGVGACSSEMACGSGDGRAHGCGAAVSVAVVRPCPWLWRGESETRCLESESARAAL